jgi:hypothetical protein
MKRLMKEERLKKSASMFTFETESRNVLITFKYKAGNGSMGAFSE